MKNYEAPSRIGEGTAMTTVMSAMPTMIFVSSIRRRWGNQAREKSLLAALASREPPG
jgi:hypothetical protein